jgi:hypothetical protein
LLKTAIVYRWAAGPAAGDHDTPTALEFGEATAMGDNGARGAPESPVAARSVAHTRLKAMQHVNRIRIRQRLMGTRLGAIPPLSTIDDAPTRIQSRAKATADLWSSRPDLRRLMCLGSPHKGPRVANAKWVGQYGSKKTRSEVTAHM